VSEAERLQRLKEIAKLLGGMPAGDLGTQEPEYRAYKIVSDEIERIEARGA
jgi:hypothetical protein